MTRWLLILGAAWGWSMGSGEWTSWGSGTALAQGKKAEEVITKLTARVEPAQAMAGQPVRLLITVQLEDGWFTYPTVQPDKGAKSMTNKIKIVPPEGAQLLGELIEPSNPKSKSEELLGIEKILYYPGSPTWSQMLSTEALKPGKYPVKVILERILVCDKNQCLAPYKTEVEATLTIVEGK